jgi:hypothetical protein
MEIEMDYLSGIFNIYPDEVIKTINIINKLNENNNPIISIGSGNGYLEYLFKQQTTSEIICIDPSPDEYGLKPEESERIMPHFSYLKDLINMEKYIEKSVLLISWPYPNDEKRSSYDYDAIKSLKPNIIVVNYGPCGASGSDKLISLIDKSPLNNISSLFRPPKNALNELKVDNKSYWLNYCHDHRVGSGYGYSGKSLRLVIYNDVPGENIKINSSSELNIPIENDTCQFM